MAVLRHSAGDICTGRRRAVLQMAGKEIKGVGMQAGTWKVERGVWVQCPGHSPLLSSLTLGNATT